MRAGLRAFSVALLLAASVAPAFGQKGVPEPREVNRLLAFSEAETGDEQGITLDGFLLFRRVGTQTPELRVDVCFPRSPEISALDRLRAPLAVNRNILAGSGSSDVAGVPTSIRLETKTAAGQVTLKGEIRYGEKLYTIREQTSAYEEGELPGGVGQELRSGSPAPNEIVATVELRALRSLLDLARQRRALIQPNQLVAGCADLREGKLIVRLVTAPRQAAALLSAIQALPGVDRANGPLFADREDGIRLPARLKDAPEPALIASFAAVARRVLGTEAAPEIRSNPATGDHLVLVTRDTDTARALGLRETVSIGLMVGPETGATENTMLYVTQVGSRFVDPAPNPLAIAQEGSDSVAYTDLLARRVSDALARAFAAEVGGEARRGNGRR